MCDFHLIWAILIFASIDKAIDKAVDKIRILTWCKKVSIWIEIVLYYLAKNDAITFHKFKGTDEII